MDPSAACGDLVVTLQPISRQGERKSVQLSSTSDVLGFSFNKVLPGKYKGKMKGSALQFVAGMRFIHIASSYMVVNIVIVKMSGNIAMSFLGNITQLQSQSLFTGAKDEILTCLAFICYLLMFNHFY